MLSRKTKTRRGLRQGDQIAPLLFNLVVDKTIKKGKSLRAVKESFSYSNKEAMLAGLEISEHKTKVLVALGRKGDHRNSFVFG